LIGGIPLFNFNIMVMRKKSVQFILLLYCLIGMSAIAIGQQTIQGEVLDKKTNEPIIGATILIKGTNDGTITEVDGSFELAVPTGFDTLMISYIGYVTQTIPIQGRSRIDITLGEDEKILQEVVVVGYGTQRKVDVTGSTASIKGEELSKQPVLTATQALQGKVAGVQIINNGKPGSSPIIRVRGISTAIAGTATLFVVDGVLTDDISNINTSDIVSMDILKDASSTAIYGARGANGVVIITTKKGKSDKLTINFNTSVGLKSPANLVEMANNVEYANYLGAIRADVVDPGTVNTDWYSQILRNAWFQNYNLSLSGGSDKMNYYISGGYLSDEGIVISDQFKRFNLRTNLDFKLNKFINTGIVASFSNGNNQIANLGTAYNNAYRAAPIIPAKEGDRYGNTSVYQNVGNPILDIEKNDNQDVSNRLQSSVYVELVPLSWFKLRSSIGGDLINSDNRNYNYSFDNDETTFLTAGGNQRNPNSNLSYTSNKSLWWVWDNIATVNKDFGVHHFTLLGGTTAEQFKGNYISAYRKDVPADKNLWYVGTGDENSSTNNGGGDKWARNSYLARLNYNYADRYLLTVTGRADGSSRLAEKNRWGFFPSIGLGWILSNEGFMTSQTLFTNLKLRGSWGRVGNDRIPSDAFVITVDNGVPYPFGGGIAVPGSAITQVKDPNLKWETTEETDVAVEFGMLKGRFTGEIGVYDKKANDLLINIKIPSVAGDQDGLVLTNAASIQNKGLEIALNWKDRLAPKFSYNIGGNVTFNQNRVIGLNGGQPILDGGIGANQIYTTKTDNDQEVGSFYVYEVLGVFQTEEEVADYSLNGVPIQSSAAPGDFKYRDTNNDGKIDDNDRVFFGSYQPKLYYGVSLGVSFGDFDVTADIFGNAGNKVYNGKKAFRLLAEDNIEKSVAYGRWNRNSGINDEPAANTGNLPASNYFIESGDFIRLNNITIGYTLPVATAQRIKTTSLRIFLTGQNVFTLKKYSGFTAELPGDPTSSGIEKNAYPTSRTIAAGININF